MTTKLIGVKEFRRNIATYSRHAQEKGVRFIILNKNTPIFEVRPLTKKDVILEELLNDVARARADVKSNRVTPLADVMHEFGLT